MRQPENKNIVGNPLGARAMGYGMWDRQKRHVMRSLAGKDDDRKSLRAWEARWHELSVQARDVFLNVVKGPPRNAVMYPSQLSVKVDKFPPHILQELKDAGFVEVKSSNAKASS